MLSLAKAATLASALFAAGASAASLTPTAPAPGASFNEGTTMTIQYDLDTTGVWTNTTVELMTGANLNMISVATIITNLDGTTGSGVLEWTVPDVTPYSEIYFLQFTEGGNASSATWTGRFTIASSTGTSTEPTNSTTTDGTTVTWGTGKLKSSSEDVATASESGATASAAASTSASASSSAASTSSADATTSSASSSAASASTESSASSTKSSSATSSAPTASATTASNTTSGAGALKAGFAAVAALAVGVVALA